jgi:hypothetical protein
MFILRLGQARPRAWALAVAMLCSGCQTLEQKPTHLIGVWGGPHAGVEFAGGLGDVAFDCASGTIDGPVPSADGPFEVKGTYRTGTGGPVRVGQIFKSQTAVYSGEVAKQVVTLRVTVEDGSALGPFILTQGAPPQLTRCL